jgi:hypothetical protein
MYSSAPESPAEVPQHVFAYGTLVDPRRLDEVLGHKHRGERLAARLDGYRRVMSASYPYAFILEAQGRFVDGVLLMDLSPYDLQVLDRYEEVERGMYQRQLVEVAAWGCGPRPLRLYAHAYVAGPALASTGP